MATLKDNLRGWREAAEIDWFSQFIKAWIPFNAWLTDTYGDKTDRELLDSLKGGSNVVFNKIVPMLDPSQDSSQDAEEFRIQVAELHRLLQGCIVEGRQGRISFERVDTGANSHRDEQKHHYNNTFRVRRGHPTKGQWQTEATDKTGVQFFLLVQDEYDREELENKYEFTQLSATHRAQLLACYEVVRPRIIESVMADGSGRSLTYGSTRFVDDPKKVFQALIAVIYALRNALFHGSITPTREHNAIYEPAYQIAMRLVRCTI